ncbi:class I SAM-dependent methyltransferase [Candidatus Sumerlaeota bacterium]|nr:class I SAM-dependent methyltransferase [Candidatus Sumerlaeota bacterium]
MRRREARAVLSLLDPKPGERILDAGCGAGFYTRLIAGRGADVLGVDGAPAMVAAAREEGLDAQVHDLTTGPPPGAPYDKILCAGVLEFCESPDPVLTHLVAGLRPDGGALILMLPRRSLMGWLYRLHHRLHPLPCTLRSQRTVRSWERLGVRLDVLRRVGFNWVVRFVR